MDRRKFFGILGALPFAGLFGTLAGASAWKPTGGYVVRSRTVRNLTGQPVAPNQTRFARVMWVPNHSTGKMYPWYVADPDGEYVFDLSRKEWVRFYEKMPDNLLTLEQFVTAISPQA